MLRKLMLNLLYRWCMANAYLTQFASPQTSAQWYRDADCHRMDLWRMERGLL